MKFSELGPQWLKDNLQEERYKLRELERSLKSLKTNDSTYAKQMQMLISARKEVVAVWERHVKEAEAK